MLESPFVSATKGRGLISQPHGGARSRGGRKPGAKNKPKPLLARVQAAAGRKSMAAVARLASIMADPEVPPAVAVQAARVLLAYGVGRPPPMDDYPGTERADAFRVTARILGIEEPDE